MVKIEQFGFLEPAAQRQVAKNLIANLKHALRSTDKIFAYRIKGIFLVIAPGQAREVLSAGIEKANQDFFPMYAQLPGARADRGLTWSSMEYKDNMTVGDVLTKLQRECQGN
jgi:hypothetical protein